MSEAEPKDRAASRPAKKEVRLTPPPRVSGTRDRGSSAAPGRPTDGRHRLLRWLTVGAFVVLAIAAVVVFGFLPRWVENQQVAGGGAPAVEGRDGSQGDDNPVGGTAEAPDSAQESSPPGPESQSPVTPPSVPTPEPAAATAVEAPPVRPLPQPSPSPPVRADRPDSEFNRHMSAGLAALERQDFAAARDHLRRAVELEPDAPEGIDALTAAEEGLRLQAITGHQAKASELEAAERWRDALAEYEAVLALDPTIRFAQEGAERSRVRAELAARLDFHLQNPERLSTEKVLQDAETLLEEASAVQPAGKRLTAQIEELGRIIQIASTPIRVALVSDNMTEVTVYKVGRLGVFERRVLELRPGNYTVVGHREGYRDVRLQLEVVPGREIEPLTVRCEEKI